MISTALVLDQSQSLAFAVLTMWGDRSVNGHDRKNKAAGAACGRRLGAPGLAVAAGSHAIGAGQLRAMVRRSEARACRRAGPDAAGLGHAECGGAAASVDAAAGVFARGLKAAAGCRLRSLCAARFDDR